MIKIFLITLLFSFPVYAQHRTVATPVALQNPNSELTAAQIVEKAKYGDIPLTAVEIEEFNAKNSAWAAGKPLRDWQSQMGAIVLLKDLENIIQAMDATTRARISLETLDKYNAKKALRLSKP